MTTPPDALLPNVSLFAHLRTQLGERFNAFDCTKATLVHISHSLEDLILREKMPAVLLTGFQESSHWRRETERYRALVDVAQQVCIFAGGTPGPDSHEREIRVTLAGDDPLRQEWFVCALTPRLSFVLCGQDHQIGTADEATRQFSTFWTFEPDVVVEVLDLLAGVVAHYRPERLPALQAARQQLPPAQPDARLMSELLRELVRFEDQLQYKLREREARYKIVSELTTDYIFTLRVAPDNQLSVEWATDSFTRIAGYDIANWAQLVHPDDLAITERWIAALLSEQEQGAEFRIITGPGEVRWIRNHARPIVDRHSGRVIRIVGAASDITVRKQAEEHIGYQAGLLEQINDAIIAMDSELHITTWNHAAEAMYGWSADEAVGRLVTDVITTTYPGGDRASVFTQLAEQGTWRGEVQQTRRDGTTLDVMATATTLRNSVGNSSGIVTVNRDITAQKQAEALRLANTARLEVLSDASRAFAEAGTSYQSVLGQIVRTIAERLRCACAIRTPSADGLLLHAVAMHDASPAMREFMHEVFPSNPISLDDSNHNAVVFRTGQPLLYLRVDPERLRASFQPIFWPLVDRFHTSSLIVMPLRVQGQTIGVLTLVRHDPEPQLFVEDDVRMAQDLADRAALAISNARLFERSQQELAERKRTEEALRESEHNLRIVTEASGIGLAMVDAEHRYRYMNQTQKGFLGLPPGDIAGKRVSDVLGPLYERVVRERLNRAFRGESVYGLLDLPRASGDDPRHCEVRIEQGRYLNEPVVVVVLSDITERTHAEQAKQRAAERLRMLADASRAFAEAEVDYQSMLKLVARRSVEVLCDFGLIRLLSADRQQLDTVAMHAEDADTIAFVQRLVADAPLRVDHPNLDQQVFQTGQPLLVPVVDLDRAKADIKPEYREAFARFAPHSLIVVPLRIRGEAMGLMGLYRSSPKWSAFTDDDLLLAQDLADRAALAISNASIFEQLQQELAERKRAEVALEQERALLAERVAERTASLSIANAELARAARLKDEFLASMSHELRTPLNSVLGRSEILQEGIYGSLTHKQQEAIAGIEESGRHLLELINDILDLSKIEADKLELERAPVAVQPLMAASLQLVAQTAAQKRIQVISSTDSKVMTLSADERRLKQILVNLLSNAVKFTPQGGQIGLELTGDPARETATFSVWDTGIGISQEDLTKLFKPFVQIDSSLSRQYEGTGLGLALVLRLAQAHGGSVAVDSTPGQGSRFSVTIPWKPSADQAVANDADVVPAHTRATMVRRALVIEDVPFMANQIARYLQELGADVQITLHGRDTVEKAVAFEPELIVLDVLLPDTSGWEVLQALKAEPRTREIPVVILSVVDEPERGRALGAAAYLVKPIDRAALAATIQRVLQRPIAPSGAPEQAAEPARPRILLAEDNQANIDAVLDYLRLKGFDVVVARNGLEALERAQEQPPEIILMDVQMPVMDGLEATRRIRADTRLQHVPIIALTALAMPGDRERCLQAGADDYLPKPISLRTLLATIHSQLGNRSHDALSP